MSRRLLGGDSLLNGRVADDHWQDPVDTPGDLPATGNQINDRRVVRDDGDGKPAGYVWDGATWIKISDPDSAGIVLPLPVADGGTGATNATDARTNLGAAATLHATQHKHGGGDEVATATPGANEIPKADSGGKLDTGWLDPFTGDSGAGGVEGLVPAPGAGDAASGKYLDADGTWTVPPSGADEKVGVTSNDTTPGYLFDKLTTTTTAISLTEINDAGDEDLQIDVADLVGDAGAGGTAGLAPAPGAGDAAANKFLKADGVWTVPPSGTDEKVGVTSNDTTPGYLADKLTTATTAVSLTEINDGGDEDLRVDVADLVGDAGAGGTAGLAPAPGAGDAAANKFLKADGTWATTPADQDEKVGVSSNDTTPGYLQDKLTTATTAVSFTEINDAGDEDLRIDVADLVGDSGAGGTAGLAPAPGAGDAAAGKFLKADGTWAVPPDTDTNDKVAVSANDTTPGYLLGKLTAGPAAVSWVEVNDAGDEDLRLDIATATTTVPGLVELATDREDAANVVVQGNDARLDPFVGDSGAGGATGLVPSPAAGDAAAGKYLDADGTWTVPAGAGDELVKVSANDTTAGYLLGKLTSGTTAVTWTEVNDAADEDLRIDVADMVGDSGAGGTAGLVPAPGAGDAAADKYLHADGTWHQVAADEVTYDNTTSGLTATDVQAAIDEVEGRVDDIEAGVQVIDTIALTGSSGTPYAETTSASYEIIGYYVFIGTAKLTPQSIQVLARRNGGTSIDLRVRDLGAATTIAELTAVTDTSFTIKDLGTLSNLTSGQAIWSLEAKRNGGGGKGEVAVMQVRF